MPTVTFDVIGTLFTLDAPGARLADRGVPPYALELWFVESLRDYFAFSHAGSYAPLKEVLGAELPRTLALFGVTASEDLVADVMGAMGRLDPVPELEESCSKLAGAGWTIQALTNGSEELTRGLLERGGVVRHFSAIHSCDSIRVSKPDRRVYEMATKDHPDGGWMVAGHAWDVAGAKLAGMRTALIASEERGNPSFFPDPDLIATDLGSAVDGVLAS